MWTCQLKNNETILWRSLWAAFYLCWFGHRIFWRLRCMMTKYSVLPLILIQFNLAPLNSINDEPPCTTLPIVKRVFLGSRTGQGFEKKRKKEGAFAPPRFEFCTPLLYNYQFSNLRRIFKARISCISSSERAKSKISIFSTICAWLPEPGIAI